MSLFDNADRVAAVIQVRRGKDVERQIKRYEHGEIIYTTDTKRLYTGDGAVSGTYGGVLASNKTWIGPSFANFSTQIGDFVYRTDAAPVGTGFYLLTGYSYPKNDIRNYVLIGGDALLGKAAQYNLPKASSTVAGGVKINNSPISIDANGFLTLKIDSTLAIDNGYLTVIGGGTNNNNNNNNNNNSGTNICNPTTTTATVPDNVAVGTIVWFSKSSVPDSSYLECDGRALNKNLYSELFGVISTTYGTGDGVNTHFKLPDLRGEFVRGWSNGRAGVDTGRVFGDNQSDIIKSHTHPLAMDLPLAYGGTATGNLQRGDLVNNGVPGVDATSVQVGGGSETRPRNVALLPMIKAKPKNTVLTIDTGCVKTGDALSMNDGVVNVNVQDGNVLKIDSDNNLYVDTVALNNNVSIQKASTLAYGIVKIKDTNSGIDVNNGIISTKIATGSNLGAVAVGSGLTIDSNTGVLSVDFPTLPENTFDIINNNIKGVAAYTTPGLSGYWTCPDKVTVARVLVVGGAGGGGRGWAGGSTAGLSGSNGVGGTGGQGGDDNGNWVNVGAAGGGGGGAGQVIALVNVVPGQQYFYSVGVNGSTSTLSGGLPSMFNTTISSTQLNQIYAGTGLGGDWPSRPGNNVHTGGAGGVGGVCSWNSITKRVYTSTPTYSGNGFGGAGGNGGAGGGDAGTGGVGGLAGLPDLLFTYLENPNSFPSINLKDVLTASNTYTTSYKNPCVIICW